MPEPVEAKHWLWVQLFLAVSLFLLVLTNKYPKNIFSYNDLILFLFVLSFFGGVAFARDKIVAVRIYYLLLTGVLFYYSGKVVLYDEKDYKAIALIITIFSSAAALFGIFEFVFGFNPLYEYFIYNPYYSVYTHAFLKRPMSTQLNPAVLASYLLASWFFGFYYITDQKSFLKRQGATVLLFFNTLCLFLTLSRSALLGFAFMLFFYNCVKKRYNRIAVISAVLVVLLLFLAASHILSICFADFQEKTALFSGSAVFSKYRLTRTLMVCSMLKDNPIFGVGLGHFRVLFNNYYPVKNEIPFMPHDIKIADNMYLTILAETGMVGLTGFLIFIFFLFKKAFAAFTVINDEAKRRLLITTSVLAGLLTNMAGYEFFYWINPYAYFCLICGFVSRLSTVKRVAL